MRRRGQRTSCGECRRRTLARTHLDARRRLVSPVGVEFIVPAHWHPRMSLSSRSAPRSPPPRDVRVLPRVGRLRRLHTRWCEARSHRKRRGDPRPPGRHPRHLRPEGRARRVRRARRPGPHPQDALPAAAPHEGRPASRARSGAGDADVLRRRCVRDPCFAGTPMPDSVFAQATDILPLASKSSTS
jgi:hypothetical protein